MASTSATYTATFQAAPGPAPVAAYGFDEGSGTTTADASGGGNTGLDRQLHLDEPGRFGSALSFNGQNARVTVNDSASLDLTTAMTLEAWVFPTELGGWRDVIYKGPDDIYYLEGSSDGTGSPPATGGTFSGSPLYGTLGLAPQYVVASGLHVRRRDHAPVRERRTGDESPEDRDRSRRRPARSRSAETRPTGSTSPDASTRCACTGSPSPRHRSKRTWRRPSAAAAPDTQPPTAPTGLGATATSHTQINLSWTAATDNAAVLQYRIERCQGTGCSTFTEIASTTGTSYQDTGRTPSTSYSYRVRAEDTSNNLGPYSTTATAQTPAPPINPRAPPPGLARPR